MEYYYTKSDNIFTDKNSLIIKDFEYKHLVKVLRKKEGDEITVTDGKRNIYECSIKSINRNEIVCEIKSIKHNLYEPLQNLTLFVSPLHNQSRFEFLIEKAVELGVNAVYPVICENTVNKNDFSSTKIERIKKIIISAMSQSQRCFMPEFFNVISFREMLNYSGSIPIKIVMYEFENSNSKLAKIKEKDICLLIGPEGGFSESEIALLKKNKWLVKSLGSRKLRAETAAVVSIYDLLK